MPKPTLALRIYRWLLALYPATFREVHSRSMEQDFLEEYAECSGSFRRLQIWVSVVLDLLRAVPRQTIEEFSQDVWLSVRLWRKTPWQVALTVSSLAIGIGAATGGFSIVNGLFLRELPFRHPDRLATFGPDVYNPPHGSAREFAHWRSGSNYFQNAAIFEEGDVNLSDVPFPDRVHVAQTSWSFFRVLGVDPALGRFFDSEHDDDTDVAVISYGFWQQRMGGRATVAGSRIRLDGTPLTVIGVAPPAFDYPGRAQVWRPTRYSAGNNGWTTVARLRDGVSWPQAQSAFLAEVQRSFPKDPAVFRPETIRLTPMRAALNGTAGQASLILMGCVVVVMLLACANATGLLLGRMMDRGQELAIRSALGASRARLMQQVSTEALLVATVSAGIGWAIAVWATSAVDHLQPAALESQSYSLFHPTVITFAAVAGLFCTALLGTLPAWFAGRVHRFANRGERHLPSSLRMREVLILCQVAITSTLLASSFSLGRAFHTLMTRDRGYDLSSVVTAAVSLDGTTYQTSTARLSYFERVTAQLGDLPWVRSASATEFLPLFTNGFMGGRLGVEGRPANRNSVVIPVLSGFFRTMGVPLAHGREFTASEVHNGARVAVVNYRFAESVGMAPSELIGRLLTAGRTKPWTIIGVIRGIDYEETDASTRLGNQVFIASASPGSFLSTFVIRVRGDEGEYVTALRDAIGSVDPKVPVFDAQTMQQRLERLHSRSRLYRTATWSFALFGALLSVAGLYGLISASVAQRTREFAVRMALGCSSRAIRGKVLTTRLWPLACAAFAGAGAALPLSSLFLSRFIEGTQPAGLVPSAFLVLVITSVASLGAWVATARIGKIDITSILKAD